MTLTAKNTGTLPVDITHPSSCEIWYGVFQLEPSDVYGPGEFVGGGPEKCEAGERPDLLAPGQQRQWSVTVDSDFGARFENADLPPGRYTLAIGLNVRPAAPNAAVGTVWYARTATVQLQ